MKSVGGKIPGTGKGRGRNKRGRQRGEGGEKTKLVVDVQEY